MTHLIQTSQCVKTRFHCLKFGRRSKRLVRTSDYEEITCKEPKPDKVEQARKIDVAETM